jgi:hypothetical protein
VTGLHFTFRLNNNLAGPSIVELPVRQPVNYENYVILYKNHGSDKIIPYLCAHKYTLKNKKIMATPIRAIPVLEGEVARRFLREMKKAEKERGTIDFSESIRKARASWATGKAMGTL